MTVHSKLRGTTTATSKGQTTIPKAMRDALGIKDGTQLDWVLKDGKLEVTAKTRRLIDLAGMLKSVSNGRHATIDEMNQAVLDEAAARFVRKTSR